jgi:predicted HTH domain antitoxin
VTTVSFDVSEEAIQEAGATPEEFARAVRLAAAMFWYGRSEVTMGTAAEIAGLDLRDFLTALSKHKQDIFAVDLDDLDQELAFLAQQDRRE